MKSNIFHAKTATFFGAKNSKQTRMYVFHFNKIFSKLSKFSTYLPGSKLIKRNYFSINKTGQLIVKFL